MLRDLPNRRTVLAVLAAAPLAACNETAGDFNPAAAPRARAPGVPVALVSLEGGPENIISRLSVAISQQAARREITIVGVDGNPRYRVRGYVSAFVEGSDGEFGWAFDIFDAQRKRARRVSGQERIRNAGDAWGSVSDAAIAAAAFKATDDIAEFLASAPAAPVAGRPAAPASSGAQRAAGLLAAP
jgi:hypothetical protein